MSIFFSSTSNNKRSWWWLKRLRAEDFPWSQQPTNFISLKPCESGDIDCSKQPRDLKFVKCLGASYTNSAPCIVWYLYIFCRCRYVFYLSRDPIKPLIWELLAACHHPKKFCDHGHSDRLTEQMLRTGEKMKFSIKVFFSKCDQVCFFLRICSHLLKKSLRGNFIFCAVPSKT